MRSPPHASVFRWQTKDLDPFFLKKMRRDLFWYHVKDELFTTKSFSTAALTVKQPHLASKMGGSYLLLTKCLTPNKTFCEESDSETKSNDSLELQLRQDIAKERARVKAEIEKLEKESCLGCLVTGVGTCVGLASYFGYLAMEEMHVKPVTLQVRQRLAFFGVMSIGWIGMGAYRLYLG